MALPPKTIYTFIYLHSPKLWDATNFIVTPSPSLHPVFPPFPPLAWFIFIQHSQQFETGTQITNIGKTFRGLEAMTYFREQTDQK